MKKIICLLLSIVFLASIVACKKDVSSSINEDTSVTQSNDINSIENQINENNSENTNNTVDTETQNVTTSKQIENNEPSQTSTSKQTHTHNYTKATCTAPSTCSCGKIQGDALGHKWSNAVCMTQRICERCNVKDTTIVQHDFSKYLCEKCGKIDPECNVFWGVNAFLSKYGEPNGKGNINCYPNPYAALSVSNYIDQDNFFIEYSEDTTGEVFSVWVKSGISTVSFRRGSTYGSYEIKNSVLSSEGKVVFDDFYTNPDNPVDQDVFATECAPKIDKYLRMAESKILIPKMGLKLSDFGFIKYK